MSGPAAALAAMIAARHEPAPPSTIVVTGKVVRRPRTSSASRAARVTARFLAAPPLARRVVESNGTDVRPPWRERDPTDMFEPFPVMAPVEGHLLARKTCVTDYIAWRQERANKKMKGGRYG